MGIVYSRLKNERDPTLGLRLTKTEKNIYSIRPLSTGPWAGECPQCRELFFAIDRATTQIAVATAIVRHERDKHGGQKL